MSLTEKSCYHNSACKGFKCGCIISVEKSYNKKATEFVKMCEDAFFNTCGHEDLIEEITVNEFKLYSKKYNIKPKKNSFKESDLFTVYGWFRYKEEEYIAGCSKYHRLYK